MLLDLDRVQRPPEPPAFDPEADPRAIGELNDAAYGTPGYRSLGEIQMWERRSG